MTDEIKLDLNDFILDYDEEYQKTIKILNQRNEDYNPENVVDIKQYIEYLKVKELFKLNENMNTLIESINNLNLKRE